MSTHHEVPPFFKKIVSLITKKKNRVNSRNTHLGRTFLFLFLFFFFWGGGGVVGWGCWGQGAKASVFYLLFFLDR